MKKWSILLIVTLAFVSLVSSFAFAETLVHWQHHAPAREVMVRQFAAEFEAQNPGVKIEIETIPLSDYYTKLLPAIAAGSGPDVFQIRSVDVPKYRDYGVIQPLSKNVIDYKQAQDEFVPGTIEYLVEKGVFYGLPTDVQTIVLFYNTDIFAEMGFTAPPQTWDEMIEMALAITEQEDGVTYRMGLAHGNYAPVVLSLMAQTGTDFLSDKGKAQFNNENGLKGFQFATDFITEYKVEDPDFGSRWTAFREQDLGMVLAHPAMLGSFRTTHPDLPIGIAEIPAITEGGSRTNIVTNWAYVNSAKSNNSDLATKWIEFLTSKDAQRAWALETGELPARISLLEDPVLLAHEPLLEAPLQSLLQSKAYPFEALAQMDAAIRVAIQRVTISGETPEQALTWLAKESEKIYQDVILGDF